MADIEEPWCRQRRKRASPSAAGKSLSLKVAINIQKGTLPYLRGTHVGQDEEEKEEKEEKEENSPSRQKSRSLPQTKRTHEGRMPLRSSSSATSSHEYSKLRCHYCRSRSTSFSYLICANYPRCKCGFCYPCLRNQFGLSPNKLRLKDWTCVVCQGLCNCVRCQERIEADLLRERPAASSKVDADDPTAQATPGSATLVVKEWRDEPYLCMEKIFKGPKAYPDASALPVLPELPAQDEAEAPEGEKKKPRKGKEKATKEAKSQKGKKEKIKKEGSESKEAAAEEEEKEEDDESFSEPGHAPEPAAKKQPQHKGPAKKRKKLYTEEDDPVYYGKKEPVVPAPKEKFIPLSVPTKVCVKSSSLPQFVPASVVAHEEGNNMVTLTRLAPRTGPITIYRSPNSEFYKTFPPPYPFVPAAGYPQEGSAVYSTSPPLPPTPPQYIDPANYSTSPKGMDPAGAQFLAQPQPQQYKTGKEGDKQN